MLFSIGEMEIQPKEYSLNQNDEEGKRSPNTEKSSAESQTTEDEEQNTEAEEKTEAQTLAELVLREENEENNLDKSQLGLSSDSSLDGLSGTNKSEITQEPETPTSNSNSHTPMSEKKFEESSKNENPLNSAIKKKQFTDAIVVDTDLRRSPWVICFCVVNFDLELGQSNRI